MSALNRLLAQAGLTLVVVAGPTLAAAQAPTVYRCPGPPVLYTDTLTPQEARSRNCKPLADLPVAVAPATVPRAVTPVAPVAPSPSAASPSGPAPAQNATTATGSATVPAAPSATVALPAATTTIPAPASSLAGARVPPDDQRARDAEARRILEAELRREEARLADAVKASATARPGERVGADSAQIRRAESDIEAIRRELGRLR